MKMKNPVLIKDGVNLILDEMVTQDEMELAKKCSRLIVHGKHQEAMLYVNKMLEMFPHKVMGHSFGSQTLKRLGRWSESYIHAEWYLQWALKKMSLHNSFNSKRWNGESFVGKRLLISTNLLGLGDILQFVRYLPMVKAKGGTVILQTDNPLFRLFEGFYGIDEFAEFNDTIDYDLIEDMISLPRLLNITPETVPKMKSYIKPKERSNVNKSLFSIGIVWACGTGNANAEERCCGLENLAGALVDHEGIAIYSLQKGIESQELANINHGLNIIDSGSGFNDFADTAALIAGLNLVISVDTSVAHLAGAMGKPVWTLLPFVSDGRWLLNCSNTPWYPSMRLFRQPRSSDWDNVMFAVNRELSKILYQIKDSNT